LVSGLGRHKVSLDPLWTLRGIAILGGYDRRKGSP
jgi:hypothetical protein